MPSSSVHAATTSGRRVRTPASSSDRLTAEALILVEHTEHILRHLEEAEAEIAAAHEAVRGRVRIATFQTAAHTMVPDAVRELAAAAEATCRRAGFEPVVAFESTDVLLHVRLVAAGAAVALVPGLALQACDTTAVRSRALDGNPTRTISIAVRRGSTSAPAIAAVRAALTARSTRGA
ncbi:LysR substrate-binding domain-containing protein [Kribbella sp. WER1]